MDLRTSAKKYLPAPVTDMLKVAKYKLETWTFPNYVVCHRYGPHEFQMHIHDRVAKEWYDKDWVLPPEFDFLGRYGLASGARVFDLGAHQCLVAMMLARQVGPEGQVVAVEADAHNAVMARRNVELNRVPNVEVIHGLISSSVGQERALPSFNASPAADDDTTFGKALVNSLSVDELSRRMGWPDVVYMDIEGFEIEALKGARETVAQCCTWFIELHGDEMLKRYWARNRDVLQFFPPEDYTAFVCLEDADEFQPLFDMNLLPRDRCFVAFVPRTLRMRVA